MKSATISLLLWAALFSVVSCHAKQATEKVQDTKQDQAKSSEAGGDFVGIERAFSRLRFDRPVYLTNAGDGSDRIFVVEQAGVVRWFNKNDENPTSQIFLDLTDRVSRSSNEEGLIGFAFHPDFKNNGFVYCHWSSERDRPEKTEGQKRPVAPNIVARYKISDDPNVCDADSEKVIMKIAQPYPNHNGGAMAFGKDGYLYLSLGDGGFRNDPLGNGQNLSTLLGAILRIDIDSESDGKSYAIPKDNPFIDTPDARPEIFALGLRNVWRFSFDRKTGDLWAADVGQELIEEVNIIEKGGNYGWKRFEANKDFATDVELAIQQHDKPVAFYGHEWGGSITGGNVYRGEKYPELDGSYFFGDYMTGNLWRTRKDAKGKYQTELIRRTGRSIASFGEDEQGEVYLLSFDGGIYQIVPAEKPEETFKNWPKKLSETGLFASIPDKKVADHLIAYEVNAPFWSDEAEKSRYFVLPEGKSLGYRAEGSWEVPVGTTIVKNFKKGKGRWLRMLETRLIKRTDQGWESATYVWDKKNKDAELFVEGKQFEIWEKQVKSWHAPSASECASCHVDAAGYVLGLNTAQLNRDGSGSGVNQISEWAKNGYVSLPDSLSKDLDVSKLPKYCNPFDKSADLETRARVYLDVNCAMCHQPKGPGNANIDLRFATSLEGTKSINANPGQGDLGIADAKLIAPGKPESSLMVQRIKTLNEGRMPSIGSNLVDEKAVELLSEWIKGMN
ncbi:MAG: PQQ-dependent sugar dehydrogenase [Mariniblastus sp.]